MPLSILHNSLHLMINHDTFPTMSSNEIWSPGVNTGNCSVLTPPTPPPPPQFTVTNILTKMFVHTGHHFSQ